MKNLTYYKLMFSYFAISAYWKIIRGYKLFKGWKKKLLVVVSIGYVPKVEARVKMTYFEPPVCRTPHTIILNACSTSYTDTVTTTSSIWFGTIILLVSWRRKWAGKIVHLVAHHLCIALPWWWIFLWLLYTDYCLPMVLLDSNLYHEFYS